MKNRDIYQKDPSTRKLANQGVASVNDDKTTEALEVLRYELETFVCDGQYAKGMVHILDTFLRNVNQPEQPGVWVSGFYGSGKSHLVKMLRSLWVDQVFPDGATARGITNLSQDITDKLHELDMEGKRHGGCHAASGTLGASASGSVRLSLLRILFKSVGLPERYQLGRFVLWLKKEDIFEKVKQYVENNGVSWGEALENFYVSTELHEALLLAKPSLFPSINMCASTLLAQYAPVMDISSEDMHTAIRNALIIDGKFPLTLVVLDEVQQFIGEDGQRSHDVQEVVEDCCKKFAGKLMFIGTGQTAVTGTSNLKKLEGRFTIRVELSDSDVDSVIRQVILAKKPDAKAPVEAIMNKNIGEISRHLASSSIAHRQDDVAFFSQDYPILPVRRRFWEKALRVLDQTGTDSQLRNQLSMIHKAIQTNLDEELGSVIPGDYLYFETCEKLIQHRIVPRKLYDKITVWIKGSENERLKARACAIIFLLNKIAAVNTELGIRTTIDTIADLLIQNLEAGSGALRAKLPAVLDNCELIMRVGDEYRIQTEESSAWNDDYQNEYSHLSNESHRIDAERDDRIKRQFGSIVQRLNLVQGVSKVARNITPVTESKLPTSADSSIIVWLRDEWATDADSVRSDARQAGNQSPIVFVFIPKRSGDDLRRYLIEYKAAMSTIDKRKGTSTPEGLEAQASIETIRKTADSKINELLAEAFSGARVFQGGGNEIAAGSLSEAIAEAAKNALDRLYSNFKMADHIGWAKVYENASKGAPDALRAIGSNEEPANQVVCKAILSMIAGGKHGTEIRDYFEGKGYGWSRDTVDGAILVLLIANLVRALDDHGKVLDPKELERKALGKMLFKIESTVISAAQRITIRKIFQKEPLKIHVTPNEELTYVSHFLQKMNELADSAGGEEPKPVRPDTRILEAIRTAAGNEQLLTIYNNCEELGHMIEKWQETSEQIKQRWPEWNDAKILSLELDSLEDAEIYLSQIRTIEQERQLIAEPDPIRPLVTGMTQLLRDALNNIKTQWETEWNKCEQQLEKDLNWNQLDPEQRHDLRVQNQFMEKLVPVILVDSTTSIISTLEKHSLSALYDRLAALPGRHSAILQGAATKLEPKAQFISFSSSTIKSESEFDSWIVEKKKEVLAALKKGPVIIR